MVLTDEERKAKKREYSQRPEVKEKHRIQSRKYSQRPEVKEKIKKHNSKPEVKERTKIRTQKYRQRPEVKEKSRLYEKKPERKARKKITDRAYSQRPEVKEKNLIHNKKWWTNHGTEYMNRPGIRSRNNATMKKNRKIMKTKLLTEYSKRISGIDHPICACCGEDFHEIFLTVDHVIPVSKTDYKRETGLYGRLIREGYPEGYQVLCRNCNFAKRDSAQCPHQVMS